MQEDLGLFSKSAMAKSFGASIFVAVVSAILYSYINHVPVYIESVWEVFFTGLGITFIVCMAAIVVYSQFDHTPHHHNHSH